MFSSIYLHFFSEYGNKAKSSEKKKIIEKNHEALLYLSIVTWYYARPHIEIQSIFLFFGSNEKLFVFILFMRMWIERVLIWTDILVYETKILWRIKFSWWIILILNDRSRFQPLTETNEYFALRIRQKNAFGEKKCSLYGVRIFNHWPFENNAVFFAGYYRRFNKFFLISCSAFVLRRFFNTHIKNSNEKCILNENSCLLRAF